MKKLLGHLSGRLQAAVYVGQAQRPTPASGAPLRIHGLCFEPYLEALAGRLKNGGKVIHARIAFGRQHAVKALAGRERCLREPLKAHSDLVWQQRLPYALHLAAKILLRVPQVVVDLHAVPELG